MAIDYAFFRDNRPEVIVEFGKRIEMVKGNDLDKLSRKELTHYLERALEETCDNQFKEMSQGDITKYNILFKQHLKWYRRIEQRLKNIDLPPVAGV